MRISDWSSDVCSSDLLKNDMEAAFALTTQVDMVMSTSTSPQRIAEAVGKEVWLMSAAGSRLNQPPTGEYGMPHHLHWQRHWTEPWSVLMERMALALEARDRKSTRLNSSN